MDGCYNSIFWSIVYMAHTLMWLLTTAYHTDTVVTTKKLIIFSESHSPSLLVWFWLEECTSVWGMSLWINIMNFSCGLANYTYRLAIYLPSGWPFIVVCIALRFIEGVGTALFNTAGYTLIIQLFPQYMGLLMVCQSLPLPSESNVQSMNWFNFWQERECVRKYKDCSAIDFTTGNNKNWFRCWLFKWTSDWRLPLQGK